MGIATKILAYVKSKPPYCQLYSQGFQSRIQNLHFESNLRKKNDNYCQDTDHLLTY